MVHEAATGGVTAHWVSRAVLTIGTLSVALALGACQLGPQRLNVPLRDPVGLVASCGGEQPFPTVDECRFQGEQAYVERPARGGPVERLEIEFGPHVSGCREVIWRYFHQGGERSETATEVCR